MKSVRPFRLIRSSLAATTLAASALAASAADLPTKARPYTPALSYSGWGGFYAGIAGGWATGKSKHVSDASNAGLDITNSFNMSGAMIGATLGYNWDIGRWVAGVEGDWSWTNKKGSGNDIPPFPVNFVSGTKEQWLATVRTRGGYSLADDWLLYATGGLAIASIKATVDSSVVSASETKTRLGWTVGAGVEKQISGNWSAKAEYLYVKFGDAGYLATPPAPVVVRGNVPVTNNIFRVGVNYRFGGPTFSKY
jgi:outer membrane immunogenic protein